ncbi:MAG: ChaN family lipoprotein, partial [Solirubrobacteraceae bacterium]
TPPALQAVLRVHHSTTNQSVSFDDMIAAAARADIVFFGEQHDDPETHFAEFALLDGIARIRPRVVVSLEMFERDVQPLLDAYLAGRMSEADFLAGSRPWERYATDYRGLVLLARARGWPVVAANIPRAIANAVSRKGLTALDTLPASSRTFAARELSCPRDAYFDRFAEEMKAHGSGGPGSAPNAAEMRLMTDRFYAAQCAKDETMGESIAQALHVAGPGAIVVHFNGAFHSDYRYGTAERARRRAPGATSVVITAIPVAAPENPGPTVPAAKAEFVVFTRKPRA